MAEGPNSPTDSGFYETLPPMTRVFEVCDPTLYAPVPNDWYLACADIEGSTRAVADGRHPQVNFAAAGVITALSNCCGALPFQFGGDGAVALVPPQWATAARRELARTRRFVRDDLGLNLRVGLLPVGALAAHGGAIRVARYEPSAGNVYANFLGDGIERFERALKGRGEPELERLGRIDESDDDGNPSDLTGLSCRWNPLPSQRGRIVSLVTHDADVAGLYASLLRIAGVDALKVASMESLVVRWPPSGILREARARRGRGTLIASLLKTAVETFVAYIFFIGNFKTTQFDPMRYRREVIANLIDFSRCGKTFNVVFDCPTDRVEPIRRYLTEQAAAGRLRFGMQVSEFALMTCLVRGAAEGQHVHFADGGDGGYTRAAAALKSDAGLS